MNVRGIHDNDSGDVVVVLLLLWWVLWLLLLSFTNCRRLLGNDAADVSILYSYSTLGDVDERGESFKPSWDGETSEAYSLTDTIMMEWW